MSFHENNIRGVAKSNIYNVQLPKFVPVFADSINAKLENENKYVIKVFAQRGLKVLLISFTSYGKDVFSSISLLIDSLNIQSDYNSKSIADFALVTYVSNLKLTDEQQVDLINLLDTKYMVSDIRKIDLILSRVKENLSLHYKIYKNKSLPYDK